MTSWARDDNILQLTLGIYWKNIYFPYTFILSGIPLRLSHTNLNAMLSLVLRLISFLNPNKYLIANVFSLLFSHFRSIYTSPLPSIQWIKYKLHYLDQNGLEVRILRIPARYSGVPFNPPLTHHSCSVQFRNSTFFRFQKLFRPGNSNYYRTHLLTWHNKLYKSNYCSLNSNWNFKLNSNWKSHSQMTKITYMAVYTGLYFSPDIYAILTIFPFI